MQISFGRLAHLCIFAALMCSLHVHAQDPTRPDGWRAGSRSQTNQELNLVLTQLVVSSESQRALINNQWLKEGDSIAGFTVRAIRSNQVVLQNNQQQRLLKLFQPLHIKNNESQGDQ